MNAPSPDPSKNIELPASISKLLSVVDFPIEQLGPAGALCRSLSQRHSVPEDFLALAALVIAGSLAGSRAEIETGLGRVRANLFTAFGAAPCSGAEAALDQLVAPVRRIQDELIKTASTRNKADIAKSSEFIGSKVRLRGGYLRGSDYEQLAGLRALAHPGILTESLEPNHLRRAFAGSVDHRLFHYSPGGEALSKLKARNDAVSGVDIGLLGRCLTGRPVQLSGKSLAIPTGRRQDAGRRQGSFAPRGRQLPHRLNGRQWHLRSTEQDHGHHR